MNARCRYPERRPESYARVEQNVYIFLGAMMVVLVSTGLYLMHFNRRCSSK